MLAALWVALAAPDLASVRVQLVPAFPRLEFEQPVRMVQAPGDASTWYLVEKEGRVRRFSNDPSARKADIALDIVARVNSGPTEAGLLGIAFHPGWPTDPRLFLSYTTGKRPLRSVIASFSRFDPGSEKRLLVLDQPYGNHNGGDIDFGPDGRLYIAFGDGGSAGDPHRNSQNVSTWLGKILRIDIDTPGVPYGIPADNPFAKGGGAPEIFAWGLRNPWNMSFDAKTGVLWTADVGQYLWEEVHPVERGKNYGWNIREGRHCYDADICRTEGLTDPVAEYSHREGQSVSGGHVYRGKAIPGLAGAYVYGDFVSGRIWAVEASGKPAEPVLLADTELEISEFGRGHDGELYVLDYYEGRILKLIAR